MTYSEKLKDPRWQRKRLEILNRDDFTCQHCHDRTKTLHVHHLDYEYGKEPWDYPDEYLITLCEVCHEEESINRQEIERLLLRQFRLKFKNNFSKHCLITLFEKLPNIDFLIYLLWENRDFHTELERRLIDINKELNPPKESMEWQELEQ